MLAGTLKRRNACVPGSPPTASSPGAGAGVPVTTIVKSCRLLAIDLFEVGVAEYGRSVTGLWATVSG